MIDSIDYKKWIGRAEQDTKVLEYILNEGVSGVEDTFCYLCQQAAEKYMKGFLLFHNQIIPKTHDLIFLLKKVLPFDSSLIELFDDLSVLNEYSVSARYPSDFEDRRTAKDAYEAYESLFRIKNTLVKLIK